MRSQCSKSVVHRPCNLIDVCGTGTTGCHGWIHAHPAEAYRLGFLVKSGQDPALVPVQHFKFGLVYLDDDGFWSKESGGK
jgi:hypothetical protein